MPVTPLWGETFVTEATWQQNYRIASWGSGVTGWSDPFAHVNMAQSGRGVGINQGWAVFSDTSFYPFAAPFSLLGISPAASGFGVGFAYTLSGSTAARTICEFGEADASKKHFHLQVDAGTSRLSIVNGTAGTIVAHSGAFTFPLFNYSHIEIIPVIDDSAGSVQVWVDSILVINATGIDTRNAGSGTVGMIQFLVSPGTPYTDLYFTDGAAQFGDKRVSYFETVADGTYTDGVAVGAASKHAAVDEVSTNFDTDYVEFDNVGLPTKYSSTTRALPSNTLSVDAVIPVAIVRKDDAGINTGRVGILSSGSIAETPDVAVQSGFTGPFLVRTTDPHTGVTWTIANANAAEPYFKRTA